VVPFVKVADNSVYYPGIEVSCRVIIRRQERFAKTAVGWILRGISQYDEACGRQVVEGNIKHFSPESLENASKYFGKYDRKLYREMLNSA
jgi:3-methyladenine DNA glycosylase AlkD